MSQATLSRARWVVAPHNVMVDGSVGCWSAYPFPDSNLIVASDIGGGLVLEYTGS